MASGGRLCAQGASTALWHMLGAIVRLSWDMEVPPDGNSFCFACSGRDVVSISDNHRLDKIMVICVVQVRVEQIGVHWYLLN